MRENGWSRLCADVVTGNRGVTIWFGIESGQEWCLCADRSDPFVLALLPMAMRSGYNICCEGYMSPRLHHQLENYFIPTLANNTSIYKSISVYAALAAAPLKPQGAVGTGFSAGVDSLFTIMKHGHNSLFPLTHIAVFNVGVFEGKDYKINYAKACGRAKQFAKEAGLRTVFLDSNLSEALPERFLDVYSFRNMAAALALQNLFSVYLLSSGHDFNNFYIDPHNTATYDLLTVNNVSTESLAVYLSGAEATRAEKINMLTEYELSYNWLHPCIFGYAGDKNCGHCKKCARDCTTLYALNKLKLYEKVIDVKEYYRKLPQRIGFVLANKGNHLFDETLQLLKNSGREIPAAAYVWEEQFYKFLNNMKDGK